MALSDRALETNFVKNSTLEYWKEAPLDPPDGWIQSSAPDSMEYDEEGFLHIADATATQWIGRVLLEKLDGFTGKTFSARVRARTATASSVAISLWDGTNEEFSSYHTGGGGWEELTVSFEMDVAATTWDLYIYYGGSGSYVDVSDATVVCSDEAPDGHIPYPVDVSEQAPVTVLTSDYSITLGGSSGSGTIIGKLAGLGSQLVAPTDTNDNQLFTFNIPANALDVNGRFAHVVAYGTTSGNTNTKTFKWTVGGSTVVSGSVAGASATRFYATLDIERRTSANQACFGRIEGLVTSAGDNARQIGDYALVAADATADIAIGFNIQKATSGDSVIVQSYYAFTA